MSGGNVIVYILIREDQNEHGYIDASIAGVFHEEGVAREHQSKERERAREQGLIVEDDESVPDWQASWKIEEHVVN
jgi:hypothetical protein